MRGSGRRRGGVAAGGGRAALRARQLHQRALRGPRGRHAARAGRAHDCEYEELGD